MAPDTPQELERSTRWSTVAVSGALLSAVVASACCVGPLVLALLGLGGGALLVAFEPYRPYLTVLTIALLGAGFYLTYRPGKAQPAPEGESCDCPAPGASRLGRTLLWIVAALVALLLTFPYYAGALLG